VIVLVCLESPSPSQASRAALHLGCSLGEKAEVVVLSFGGEAENASIELARQSASVRRIVHLQNTGIKKVDFFTLGMILAEASRYLAARVVLTGEHSDSEGQGMVPAALAHHLQAPLFGRVQAASLAPDDEVLHLTVRSGGRLCKVMSRLPVVLATQPARGIDHGQPAEGRNPGPTVEVLSLAQLGMDASRLVPRPELLGTFVAAPAEIAQHKSFDEAARIILRGQ
jgi:electron transfer flavoprotein alpha/beta subunit